MWTKTDEDLCASELAELNLDHLLRLPDQFAGIPEAFDQCGNDVSTKGLLSFVIPVKDEEATLVELFNRIAAHVPNEYDYEVVFIDDGSGDQSWNVIAQLTRDHADQVRGIRFRSNAGKAAGLSAGFRAARGDIIFTLDGDLQDDPSEIPRFLEKLDEGYGLVTGWKKVRHDPWHKVLPSRIFNWMLSNVGGVKLHDHNCGFKCYRAELAKQLTLHGELHRMVPSLAAIRGFRSAEIVVQHHPRRHGQSKYGVERFLRGFSDMMTIGFLKRFRERPSHCINGIAAAYMAIGIAFGMAGAWAAVSGGSGLMPLLTAAAFGGMAVAVFVCGLMSELIIRGGLEHQWRLPIVADTAFNPEPQSANAPNRPRAFAPVPTDYRLADEPAVA